MTVDRPQEVSGRAARRLGGPGGTSILQARDEFSDIELLLALPEHQVTIPVAAALCRMTSRADVGTGLSWLGAASSSQGAERPNLAYVGSRQRLTFKATAVGLMST